MSADFEAIRRELSGLRKRAKDIEDGATKGVELPDSARFMLYAIDRIKMLTDDVERELKNAKRPATP